MCVVRSLPNDLPAAHLWLVLFGHIAWFAHSISVPHRLEILDVTVQRLDGTNDHVAYFFMSLFVDVTFIQCIPEMVLRLV